ncbi:MFS transporter [Lentzea cavernae]|uniref:MFS transporter n=1 Tax=Lentzea cavernae TaxID=2020703 RepID=UPI001E2F8EC3|nr:MFS transporter [Lentzea cavernae]
MTDKATAPSVLRNTAFLRLWTGTTASGLAMWALPFVLGLAVLERSITAVELGVVLATRTVGFLVAVPVAGVLADRHSRRNVVFWSCITGAVMTPVIALGMDRSLLLMAAAAAIVGAGQGGCRPAFQALVAEVVPEEQRQQANAATTLAIRVTTLVAPSLTALAALVTDAKALLVVTAVLWLVAALVPPRGNHAPARTTGKASFAADFLEGLHEARRHPWLLAGLGALTSMVALGYSATAVLLPLVSRDRYGTEAVLAAAMTAYTIGALAGAALMARWRPRTPGWTALAGMACYGLVPLALLLPVHPFVLIAVYVAGGVGMELFNVPWFTAVQREVEPGKLARVSSLDFLLSFGLAPVGLAFIAPAVDQFGSGVVLGFCAVACFAAPAAAALVPSSKGFTRSS